MGHGCTPHSLLQIDVIVLPDALRSVSHGEEHESRGQVVLLALRGGRLEGLQHRREYVLRLRLHDGDQGLPNADATWVCLRLGVVQVGQINKQLSNGSHHAFGNLLVQVH